MGLMAVHLILLAVNKFEPELDGMAKMIYSNCLGALKRVVELPPQPIPTHCYHSNVLKNILINWRSLSFSRCYSHVSTHQDNQVERASLSKEVQLNCACDAGAKDALFALNALDPPRQRPFPLEPVAIFVGGQEIISGSGPQLRFTAHQILAKTAICLPTNPTRLPGMRCIIASTMRSITFWRCGLASTR